MESVQRISKTDLARNTREVLNTVMRGQTALIESHGKAEAAIIDIVDYLILRAVMRYHAAAAADRRGRRPDRCGGRSDLQSAGALRSRHGVLSGRCHQPEPGG